MKTQRTEDGKLILEPNMLQDHCVLKSIEASFNSGLSKDSFRTWWTIVAEPAMEELCKRRGQGKFLWDAYPTAIIANAMTNYPRTIVRCCRQMGATWAIVLVALYRVMCDSNHTAVVVTCNMTADKCFRQRMLDLCEVIAGEMFADYKLSTIDTDASTPRCIVFTNGSRLFITREFGEERADSVFIDGLGWWDDQEASEIFETCEKLVGDSVSATFAVVSSMHNDFFDALYYFKRKGGWHRETLSFEENSKVTELFWRELDRRYPEWRKVWKCESKYDSLECNAEDECESECVRAEVASWREHARVWADRSASS